MEVPYKCDGHSFVAAGSQGDAIQVMATIQPPSMHSKYSAGIKWEIPEAANKGTETLTKSGVIPLFTIDPLPEEDGRGGIPLEYNITASVAINGEIISDTKTIKQDKLDTLRQEYNDVVKDGVSAGRIPARQEFDQSLPAYSGLLGNASGNYGWHILDRLNKNAIALDALYDGVLNPTSGYRTPANNKTLSGAVGNSNHIFGQALDYDQLTSEENWKVWDAASDAQERFLYNEDNTSISEPQTGYPWPILNDGSLKDVKGNPVTGYGKGHVAW